jgi:hypothetical protein
MSITKSTSEEVQHNEQDHKGAEVVVLLPKETEIQYYNIDIIDKEIKISITKFWSKKRCWNYVRKKIDCKIYLILLKALSRSRMSALKRQHQNIFVFEFNSSNPWTKEEDVQTGSQLSDPIVTQILNARHQLKHSNIFLDIKSRVCVESPLQDFITDSQSFARHQQIMDIIIRAPSMDESKKDFIECCRQYCNESSDSKINIDLFDSIYRKSDAITWYTKQSFLYRLLNRAFAADDIGLVLQMRYFVCNLYKDLIKLHDDTFNNLGPKISVYRGKLMSRDEFHALNASIGECVVTKSFLSASLDKKVAEIFSGNQAVTDGNVSVIFRIILDQTSNESKSSAFIGHMSNIVDEAEFILPPGMKFKNREIKPIRVCDTYNQIFIFTVHCRKTCLKLYWPTL